jgi:protein TonB
MEANKILSADILDIIFEGRNKEYGAYELRKLYNKRLTTALIITAALALLIFLWFFISSMDSGKKKAKIQVTDVELAKAKEEKKNEPPPPPPPPKLPPPPKIETVKFTPPKIVKDEEVQEPPPTVEKQEQAKIDVKSQEGDKDQGIVAPVEDKGQVVEAPKKVEEDYDKVFTKVEIEASFPGGDAGWNRYIQRELEKEVDALTDDGNFGTCTVQFIVDKEGNVSQVEALTMKGTKLAELAVKVIKKGPKWTPAQQNGRQVTAYRRQNITFKPAD